MSRTPHTDPQKARLAAYARRRRAAITAGRKFTIDASPVRNHIITLSQAGIGRRTLAAETGIHEKTIHRIRSGESRSVQRATAEAILAVPAHDVVVAERALCGTARFRSIPNHADRRVVVLALAGRGLSPSAIGTHVGTSAPVVKKLLGVSA